MSGFDYTDREAEDREAKQYAKLAEKQLRADIQAAMSQPGVRRVVWAFLQASAVDQTPLRATPELTAHAIGWGDGARWWLDAMRRHCPEREGQMRKESKEAPHNAVQDEDDDD